MNLTPNLPSTLHRLSEAEISEEIGSGPLFKMVRISLSDPDKELWRYSINAGGQTILGAEIAAIANAFSTLD
jgi:hypothetical protein